MDQILILQKVTWVFDAQKNIFIFFTAVPFVMIVSGGKKIILGQRACSAF